MRIDFEITQGTLLPYLDVIAYDDNGDYLNLSAASDAIFRLRRFGDSDSMFERTATISQDANDNTIYHLTYAWQDGDTDYSGLYEGEFVAAVSGKPYNLGHVVIRIAGNATGTDDDPESFVFCTAAQARKIVRRDVDVDDLALAHTIISLRTAVPVDADGYYADLDDQDKIGLRQATAIVARWLPSQPDYFERLSVSSEAADGESRTYTPGALILPPLAEYALANTRFNGSGMYVIDTPRDRAEDTVPLSSYELGEIGWTTW